MANRNVVFLAQEWRQHEDPTTRELVIEASSPSLLKRCLVVATPVPGTDPVQVTYSCQSVTCTGENQCVLKTRVDPDGSIVHYCDCDPIGAVAVSAAGAKKSRKKAN
jgi:hypothetical protein